MVHRSGARGASCELCERNIVKTLEILDAYTHGNAHVMVTCTSTMQMMRGRPVAGRDGLVDVELSRAQRSGDVGSGK